jgi:hypothetical protein
MTSIKNSEIKNLWPTEVMFGKIDQTIIQELVPELLINLNLVSAPGDLSDGNLNDQQYLDRLPNLKKFYNETVPEVLKEYCTKVHDYILADNSYKIKSWINNGSGHYSLGFHNHSGAQISAVFYLLVEESKHNGGQIIFHDPRFNANRGLISSFKKKHDDLVINPQSGDFIIMPSYLYHSVNTFNGLTRIIMPVDVYVTD